MFTGRLLALILIATPGLAAPQLTTIQDTLYNANGTPMTATAVITWASFVASDGSAVGAQSLTISIVNGSIYVQLVPNTTGNPSQPYTVTYTADGYLQYQETWMVPPSVTPLRVRDVRTSSTTTVTGGGTTVTTGGTGGTSGTTSNTSTITEASVTGLVNDLALRPVKGTGYGTGRVAIVDDNGAVDTVAGNFTDCVYVNGTSGPCFDPTQLPGYSDGESPTGVVDGANDTFGLVGQPTPPASLLLFRNGMLQKQGFDYTLSGTVLTYSGGAIPQPGDTLVASYRLPPTASSPVGTNPTPDSSGSSNGVIIYPTLNAQVICGATGTATQSATLTSLGSCTIPASFLHAGDRVEVRFLFSHSGTAAGISYVVKWGSTAMVQRSGGINDAMISGRADAMVTGGVTQIEAQSYGTVLSLLPLLASASDALTGPIQIDFQAAAGVDTVGLVSYTVVRYPAISHP
jgi:hypothetical protein